MKNAEEITDIQRFKTILAKLLVATPEKILEVERVLDPRIQGPAISTTGPLLIGMLEAAKLLGVSRATLWRMLNAGTLERVGILPGSSRLRRADVLALVNERRNIVPAEEVGGCE